MWSEHVKVSSERRQVDNGTGTRPPDPERPQRREAAFAWHSIPGSLGFVDNTSPAANLN